MSETHIPTPISNDEDASDPLDLFADILEEQKTAFEREGDGSITFSHQGDLGLYAVNVMWCPDSDLLHVCCGYELTPTGQALLELRELVRLVNQRIWIGHIDFFEDDSMLFFRSGIDLDGSLLTREQTGNFLQEGINVCDQYRLSFKAVIQGCTALQALERVVSEDIGHA